MDGSWITYQICVINNEWMNSETLKTGETKQEARLTKQFSVQDCDNLAHTQATDLSMERDFEQRTVLTRHFKRRTSLGYERKYT